METVDIEVVSSELMGDGGFARLRRCQVRSIRQDGTRSPAYTVDAVERPSGADAVAVLPYEPGPPVRILLRKGIRPALRIARAGEPTREGVEAGILLVELVAGVLEQGDVGQEGLRRRAALELWEEVGLRVDPARIQPMGPPVILYPGLIAERLYVCRVAASLDDRVEEPEGDGSEMERGSSTVLLELDAALARCAAGEIEDARTELALRRLADALG